MKSVYALGILWVNISRLEFYSASRMEIETDIWGQAKTKDARSRFEKKGRYSIAVLKVRSRPQILLACFPGQHIETPVDPEASATM